MNVIDFLEYINESKHNCGENEFKQREHDAEKYD